jgi:hypothetical protein
MQAQTIGTFFNRHPGGNVDQRTDLYYLQTTNWGAAWTTVEGRPVPVPVREADNPARIVNYAAQGKLQYTVDLQFDSHTHPVLVYITSRHHAPGPKGEPRDWMLTRWDGQRWHTHRIGAADHNYDHGSLILGDLEWCLLAPTEPGPQPGATGGDLALWTSRNRGETWTRTRLITRHSAYNHSYARRPLQARDPFGIFWADGDPRQFSPSRLYFGQTDGERYWQLPVEMKDAMEAPHLMP